MDIGVTGTMLNDMARVTLGPLEQHEPREFLRALAQSRGLASWDDPGIDRVLVRLDDHFPFFLQKAFAALSLSDRTDEAYLEDVFQRQIWPDLRWSFFQQFDERLAKRFQGDQRRAAEKVLDRLAKDSTGVLTRRRIDTLLRDLAQVDHDALLNRLEGQDFIRTEGGGRYRLALCLLRRWRLDRGA